MAFDNIGRMTPTDFDEIDAIIAAEDRGENPFNLIIRTPEQIALDQAAVDLAQEVKAAAVAPVKTGSKKDQAIAIYLGLEDKSRQSVIKALTEVGFKAATASTYQASLRKWINN